jgi:hypothetical protein
VDLFIAYRVGFVWFAASDMPDAANKGNVCEQRDNA